MANRWLRVGQVHFDFFRRSAVRPAANPLREVLSAAARVYEDASGLGLRKLNVLKLETARAEVRVPFGAFAGNQENG